MLWACNLQGSEIISEKLLKKIPVVCAKSPISNICTSSIQDAIGSCPVHSYKMPSGLAPYIHTRCHRVLPRTFIQDAIGSCPVHSYKMPSGLDPYIHDIS